MLPNVDAVFKRRLNIGVWGLIQQLRRSKKHEDIRIDENTFYYWDGWFEHHFDWSHVSKVRG